MIYEGPPHLHALVAWICPVTGRILTEIRMMPLEDAVDYQRFGFIVLVDPADERDLAMYRIFERAAAKPVKSKWFDRS